MTLDIDALWLALVLATVVGGVKMLTGRLASIDRTLRHHGCKLVRIETKLGIPDTNGDA